MNEALAVFIEDVDDQLGFMESALINIQELGVNEEDIGALFRAMHTIKGTAGMFDFKDVVSFAHIAENLLSDVRENKISLEEDMLDVLFKSKDHMQILVDLAIEDEDLDKATKVLNDELLNVLRSMTPTQTTREIEKISPKKISVNILWHISFRLKSHFFSSGMDIISILSFFNMLGTVKNKLFIDADIPDIESLNPTGAYIGYEILFMTDVSYLDIQEIFEFIIDDIELSIFKADDKVMLEALLDLNMGLKEELNSVGFENILNLYKDKKSFQEMKAPLSKEVKKSFSIRVDSTKIDQLINQISEMVIINAKMTQRADALHDNELDETAIILSDMIEEIRTGIMNIRMVQVGDSFNKFKRIVYDVSKKIDKIIDFQIIGGETELDKMVVEKISDPLIHMLRNSIDHGIETPRERKLAGKSEKGHIELKIYPDAGTIVMEISDDGRGLCADKILNKAIANGVVKQNNTLSDKEIYHLIFAAGLSTVEEVSDISGRGVGMDVVKRNIESLRGTIEIDSKLGEGSLFTIRLPLTLAIIDGFLVQSGSTKYIIPLEMIQECIELNAYYKKEMDGNEYINLRDSILPLLDLRTLYKEDKRKTERENIVVVRYGDYRIGMMVDELFGEFQTVIKPLGSVFKNVPGVSGGTILGSGEIALILDIPKLMEYRTREMR